MHAPAFAGVASLDPPYKYSMPSSLSNAAQDLIDRGEPAAALVLLSQASGADVLAARASAHLALGDAEAALSSATEGRRLAPDNAAAAFNMGRALMMLAEPERAVEAFAAAERGFPGVAEISARLGGAAFVAGDNELAVAALSRALDRAPGHADAFHQMAQLLFQRDDPADLDRFLDAAVARGGASAFRAASTLARLGRRSEALAALLAVSPESRPSPAVETLAAEICRDEGDLPRAFDHARKALALSPGDPDAALPLAKLLLIDGAFAEAEALARAGLAASPQHQLWLALLWTALAARGLPDAAGMIDPEQDVAIFDLAPPPGYASIAAFNAALSVELEPLHARAGPPIAQSVHGGSQTRRPLQSLKTPAIAAFFEAIVAPIDAFIARMPNEARHPFYGRTDKGWRVNGAWSVALKRGGRHASHVHPGGWISSAYYVAVPPSASDAPENAGWFTIGAPPFAARGLGAPLRVIEPVPGRLVLFPSYCWHGTVPFAGEDRRLTVAFDCVPARTEAAARA